MRRCIAVVEELIDADEHVALLAVHLLARMLQECSQLVVPLLLSESDVMRGVLMLCDGYIERIKRGQRVSSIPEYYEDSFSPAAFRYPDFPYSFAHTARDGPLRVVQMAVECVLDAVGPKCGNVLDVLSYRVENQRVRTVLDIVASVRTCPPVRVVDRWPRELPESQQFRTTIVADAERGRPFCPWLCNAVLKSLSSVWARPFNNTVGGPAQQQLLDMIELRARDAFAFCDAFLAIDPVVAVKDEKENEGVIEREEAKLGDAAEQINHAFGGVEPALFIVDKCTDEGRELHARANAHIDEERRALDRVRLFHSLLTIR